MRVGHLIKSLGRGGAEALLPLQVRNAPHTEFRAGFFLPWKDALVRELTEAGCPVRCFQSHSSVAMMLAVRRVRTWIAEQRLDLLHCHLPLAGVVGRLAARGAGVPVVYTEHNLLERYHPLTRFLNLATWNHQTCVIAVSAEVAESIRRRVGGRVVVETVRNGIDTTAFRLDASLPTAKRRLGLPEDAPVVGTVAVFRVQKRLDRWLAVARRIHRKHGRCRFLLVGDGPEMVSVERTIDRFDLREAVLLAGLQEDVRPYLAAMDVFMIASDFEGLPLALLEAMAAGVPVVSTPVGGIPEVLASGGGYLASQEEELASQTSRLLEDPEARTRLGQRARSVAESEFSIARMTQDLDAIYRSIVFTS